MIIDFKDVIIAVDFDGTCVTHEYPEVGRDIGAVPVLRQLVERGAKLILWTMRSNAPRYENNPLTDAANWFAARGIPLWGINENPTQKSWTQSPKAYAHIYIDDAALGIPRCKGLPGERDYVDWDKVSEMLFGKE